MQTNILWTGIEYHSLENCVLTKTNEGVGVNSVIIGGYDNKIYQVEYLIKTNRHWETILLEVKTRFSDKKDAVRYHSDGKGNWKRDGMPANEFKDCTDVDISLTPFTNSLPINRLQWEINKPQQIKVLFVDILSQEVRFVQQQYTKLSNTEFKFENVPNDFEAVIIVDELGLVVNYPELFSRADMRESNY
jgi:uncharacterized protein